MSYTLGIDTSFEVTVGLACDGEPLDSVVVADTRAHAEALAPSIRELCERHHIEIADITGYAVGMGPGPFTGLRVGIVTAWTLAAARNVAPMGVCSLDVIARQWLRSGAPGEFVIASDARRKELYWARYGNGIRVDGPNVTAPDALPPLPVAGPAVEMHPELFGAGLDSSVPAGLDAAVLAADAALLPGVDEPMYLRAADATLPTRRKSVLPRNMARRR